MTKIEHWMFSEPVEDMLHEDAANEAIRLGRQYEDAEAERIGRAILAAVEAEEPSTPLVVELIAYLDAEVV